MIAEQQANEVNQVHKGKGKNYGESLGKDSFLKLLVTQLKHQDPTKPMEDREFIAQMAQFSSLEQMNNMSKELEKLNLNSKAGEAYSLIGKYINAFDSEHAKGISGEVSHIIKKGNEILVGVDDYEIRLEDIAAVYPAGKNNGETKVINLEDTLKKAAANEYDKNAAIN
ncbi:MAG: flagellar hook assembly protein FlgD [Spirochaetes bacterium]|nr:flagellar hook assembly protein FlgD [Spirochaetota bacterium]